MIKNKSLLAVGIVALLGLSSISSVSALDLEEIDATTPATTTTATATGTGTTTTETTTAVTTAGTALPTSAESPKAVKISNMEVIFNDTKLPADDKSETTMYVRVNDNTETALTETDVSVKVEITANEANDKGSIKSITFDKTSQLFNVIYVAGKKSGDVAFKITASSKLDPTTKLEQGEGIKLEEVVAPVITPVETPTTTTTTTTEGNVENVLTSLDTTEGAKVETEKVLTSETDAKGINIVESKVIDANRLKITFDREIFLPDEPLSLVKITKSSDNSDIKISNITLSEDKMSLVVLTTDNLGKEPYKVAITEVIDGVSKKKVAVVNSELTVTGFNEIFVALFGLMIFSAIIAFRRKSKV